MLRHHGRIGSHRAVTDTDDGQPWPKGPTEGDGKLHPKRRLLVPKSRVFELCEAWHHPMVHPSVPKQAQDTLRHFSFDDIGFHCAL